MRQVSVRLASLKPTL